MDVLAMHTYAHRYHVKPWAKIAQSQHCHYNEVTFPTHTTSNFFRSIYTAQMAKHIAKYYNYKHTVCISNPAQGTTNLPRNLAIRAKLSTNAVRGLSKRVLTHILHTQRWHIINDH